MGLKVAFYAGGWLVCKHIANTRRLNKKAASNEAAFRYIKGWPEVIECLR